jgi:hypothetical protein
MRLLQVFENKYLIFWHRNSIQYSNGKLKEFLRTPQTPEI